MTPSLLARRIAEHYQLPATAGSVEGIIKEFMNDDTDKAKIERVVEELRDRRDNDLISPGAKYAYAIAVAVIRRYFPEPETTKGGEETASQAIPPRGQPDTPAPLNAASAQAEWTPLHIELLIHYRVSASPFERIHAPACLEYTKQLEELRLIENLGCVLIWVKAGNWHGITSDVRP